MKRILTILATIILAFVMCGCDCIMGDACGDFWRPVIEATENAK